MTRTSSATARVLDFSRCVDDRYSAQLKAINGGKGIQHPLDIVDGPVTYFEREDGSLGYVERDVSTAEIAKAEEILADVVARDGRRSEYFKHPELRDIPVTMLRRIAYGDKGVMPKKDVGVNTTRKTTWTMDELWDTEFPEVRFRVDGIVPEGLSLLVAAPKVGKSYWVACLIVALLWDVRPFGMEDGEPHGCDVLLITPDDPSARRLKGRILSIAKDLGLEREHRKYDLIVEEEWPAIEDGGADELDEFLMEHPQCKAVFIDTLERLRDGTPSGGNWMKADERAMAALKAVADAHTATIVATHHDRKNKDTADVLDVVSGGRKITGGADAILIVDRPRNSPYGKLQLIGRDIEDAEYHVSFDYPVWKLGDRVGEGDDSPRELTRKDQVLDVMREHGGQMTAQEVHQALQARGSDMDLGYVRATLSRLTTSCLAIRQRGTKGQPGTYRCVM